MFSLSFKSPLRARSGFLQLSNASCTRFCLIGVRSSPGLSRREAGLFTGSRAPSGSSSSRPSNEAIGKGRTTSPARSLSPETQTTTEGRAAGKGGGGGGGGGEFDCKVTQHVKNDGNAEIPLGLHKLSRDDLEVGTICEVGESGCVGGSSNDFGMCETFGSWG